MGILGTPDPLACGLPGRTLVFAGFGMVQPAILRHSLPTSACVVDILLSLASVVTFVRKSSAQDVINFVTRILLGFYY